MLIQLLFFILSLILTLLFFLYGFNYYYLLKAARRYKAPTPPENFRIRPSVLIQLPVYNERYVLRRLVAACAVMAEAYGIEQARILILDDSDDDTVSEIDQVVREYKEKHFQIDVLRRANRDGFKAGALQAALEQTSEEFIAIFDADFVPPADFLLRTLPYFVQNEKLGIVQSRWYYLNKDYNLLTQAISHAIDTHFLIEQPGRYAAGIFQNFNGSGGVFRKKAILDAGGWQADTLAEDIDLSYRMQIIGYRILYLRDLLCPGEIPPTVPYIKLQQGRWACGTMRVARKNLPGLFRNHKIGFKQKAQAFINLTGYMIHPLMVLSFILSCFAAFLKVNTLDSPQVNTLIPAFDAFFATRAATIILLQNIVWVLLVPFIALCTLAPWVSIVTTMKTQNLPLARNLASLFVLLLICFGISLSTTRGVGRALFTNRAWEWTRTPKYAALQNKQDWRQKQYQLPADLLWILELMCVLLGLLAIKTALLHVNYTILFMLVPFTISYGFVLLFSIPQRRTAKA
jgi:cellulose synthase/poly-beta-1,6-N-acetylglucosamine synthase-like glycosyltransferase